MTDRSATTRVDAAVEADDVLPTEQPPDGDVASAQAEATSFGAGTLEEDAARMQAVRNEQYRDHIKRAILLTLWLVVGLFLSAVLSLAWHYLGPARYHWLSPEQVEKIQTVVFTALAASGIKVFVNKHV